MQCSYSTSQVRAAEVPLLAQGRPLMQEAAYIAAQHVIRHCKKANLTLVQQSVLILAGKGNNGGDALYAGAYLARRGMSVAAAVVAPGHQEAIAAARRAGVQILENPPAVQLKKIAQRAAIWLDGLLGIGAKGAPRPPIADWLEILNSERKDLVSKTPPYIVAIDIPSGIDADTGEIPGQYLSAAATIAMGCLKPGLLLPPAAHYAGEIEIADLGFAPYLTGAPAVIQFEKTDRKRFFSVPSIADNKYTRGVVGIYAGSRQYPGAGVLCTQGAQAVGAGMVRYLGESPLVASACPEVVPVAGKIDAVVIGSGIVEIAPLQEVFSELYTRRIPTVLDAGGLQLLTEKNGLPDVVEAPIILTPHTGELCRLLRAYGENLNVEDILAQPRKWVQQAALYTQAVVVLKGAVTLIASPSGYLAAQGDSSSWLATAGSGDVLAGILGGILGQLAARYRLAAQHRIAQARAQESAMNFSEQLLVEAAAAAVYLHSTAGKIAAGQLELDKEVKLIGRYQPHHLAKSGKPIKASDIIGAVPFALADSLKGRIY